jgi:hypothetical protein
MKDLTSRAINLAQKEKLRERFLPGKRASEFGRDVNA